MRNPHHSFSVEQTYPGTDLTDGGVGAIKSIADKINEESVLLKESISKLPDQFRQMGVSMSANQGVNCPGTPGIRYSFPST